MPGELSRARGLVQFFNQILHLKSVPRTGWIDRGVPVAEAESVAEHSFQMAIVAWMAAAADPSLDRDRVLKLAVIHDLPEAVIGDITPYDPGDVPDGDADPAARRAFLEQRQVRSPERSAAKRRAEAAAMSGFLELLQRNARHELAALWHEIEEGHSAEARFVKQADKLETWLQARAYLSRDSSLPMASFDAEIDDVLHHPALIAIRDAAKSK